jgi:hypothetical protein
VLRETTMKAKAKPKGQLVVQTLPEARWDGALTNSARSTFLNCRKKFEWQYMRRLSPRAPSIPFLVGGLVHNGLERLYKTGVFRPIAEGQIVAKACEEACLDSSLNPQQSDKVWEQQAMIMGILRGYAKLYLAKDMKAWEVLEAESSFSYDIPNGWTAQGKRDMVVRRRSDRKMGLVEHKTAGRVDANYVSKLPLDNQIIGYANALKKKYGRLPDFVVYNIMKKSQLRKGQKETFEKYQKRIEDDYTLNPSSYFYRETLTISEKDARRFEEELFRFAKEMERAIEEGFFYKNTGQCTAMGVCPYMPLCIEGPNRANLSRFRERAELHEELAELPAQGE